MYVSLTYPLNIVQHTLWQIVEHCKLESLTTPDNIVWSTVTSCWASSVCQFDLSQTEQRPMNNESCKFMKLSPVTLAAWHFTANFYQRCKQETTRSNIKCFIVFYYFPLSGKKNYVDEFSAERQRAIISWDQFKQKAKINNILIYELWNCPLWP